MRNEYFHNKVLLTAAIVVIACATAGRAQESAGGAQAPTTAQQQTDERRTVGTVTSVGRGSLLIQTDEGMHFVYAVNPQILAKAKLQLTERVRVTTRASDSDPAPEALAIDRMPPREGLAPQTNDPIPQSVRSIEATLEKQVKKYRGGLMLGAALDPELITATGFATLGPVFGRDLSFRPGLEIAFGEVTTLLALHLDVLYRLPGVSRSIRWAPYVGFGPNFSFSRRSVDEGEFISGDIQDIEDQDPDEDPDADEEEDDNDRFDFSQFDWNNGINFIVGARSPGGMFFEMKATTWGVATVRMVGGFEF